MKKIYNDPKGFVRTRDGNDWRIAANDDPKCDKCLVDAVVDKKERKSYGIKNEMETTYNEISIKCPICGKTGEFNSELSEKEEFRGYQSNEYSRVYG